MPRNESEDYLAISSVLGGMSEIKESKGLTQQVSQAFLEGSGIFDTSRPSNKSAIGEITQPLKTSQSRNQLLGKIEPARS